MRESTKDTRVLKGDDSDPIEDITVSYQCQYNVTNTGSADVTATVDSTSIDLGTLASSASDTFFLDYNGTAGVCPNVTVSAAGEECTASASWPLTASDDNIFAHAP